MGQGRVTLGVTAVVHTDPIAIHFQNRVCWTQRGLAPGMGLVLFLVVEQFQPVGGHLWSFQLIIAQSGHPGTGYKAKKIRAKGGPKRAPEGFSGPTGGAKYPLC